ncbi:MAG: SpoIID/LytB domain-containing protein [Archangiaceae bacterium]|nr:SpoIID/LytB domain-containing protein [Archangiaceae bacterium]
MENTAEVTFASKGRLKLKLSGEPEKTVEGPAGARWRVRRVKGTPAAVRARIQIAELVFADKEGLEAAKTEWVGKGLKVRTQVLGQVFGIAGKVIDNRRYLLLIDEPLQTPEKLAPRQAQVLADLGIRTTLFEQVDTPAHLELELLSDDGSVVATAKDKISVESPDALPIEVQKVEYAVGYDNHGYEDRAFRGALQLMPDRAGMLAVVNLVSLEDLLKGLVPSEIFAKAHPEALKAQAVTARSEVLAKVGLKHLADPYLLCTEQHCAVYRGIASEQASTTAAVEATAGEGLFAKDGHLVDATYSAVCGGHTENNEIVWGGPPNPSLRGVPDTLPGKKSVASPSKGLGAFLAADAAAACKLSSFAQPTKYRWEKRFTAKDVDEKVASLNVGTVFAMNVTERGVSGRARLLSISGDQGANVVRGELNIRKLFGMLNSAMFEVRAEKDPKGRPTGWIFTGGGWGHGVGMCQTGAIGRAEAGQNYREILGHYYSGAQVARIY